MSTTHTLRGVVVVEEKMKKVSVVADQLHCDENVKRGAESLCLLQILLCGAKNDGTLKGGKRREAREISVGCQSHALALCISRNVDQRV